MPTYEELVRDWLARRTNKSSLSRSAINIMNNLSYLEKVAIEFLRRQGVADADGALGQAKDQLSRELYGRDYFTLMTLELDAAFPKGLTRVEYDSLIRVACNVHPVGNWYMLLGDLMGNIEHDVLPCHLVPDVVSNHPNTSLTQLTHENFGVFLHHLKRADQSLETRYNQTPDTSSGQLIKVLIREAIKNIRPLVTTAGILQRQWNERQQKAEFEKQIREAKAIPGAENHVDAFDQNKEVIERTA